jgi:hypothetical protein
MLDFAVNLCALLFAQNGLLLLFLTKAEKGRKAGRQGDTVKGVKDRLSF